MAKSTKNTPVHSNTYKTLLDNAIKESYKVSLNAGKYSLNNILTHIKSLGKLNDFPNLEKLNRQTPGIIVLNCGGMPIFKLPFVEPPKEKKSKAKKDEGLF